VWELDRVHRVDAIEGLKNVPDDSVDLLLTDPPYAIASKDRTTIRRGKPMSTLRAWGGWDVFHPFDYDLLILQLITQAYRVLKPGGALYLFTSRENNGYFVRRALGRGFVYRNHLVMIKTSPLPSLSRSNWRSAFEICMYLTKGKPRVFNFLSQKELVNAFSYPIRHRSTDHPTEKPLALFERIVRVSSNEGDLVVDPFMGSGTTAVAAKRHGRRFLGFELNPEYVAMATNRLRLETGRSPCDRSIESRARRLGPRGAFRGTVGPGPRGRDHLGRIGDVSGRAGPRRPGPGDRADAGAPARP